MDFLRRQRRAADFDAIADATTADELLDDVIGRETAETLRRLLRSLDEDARELIRLRYVVDLTYGEIAELTGRREDAVRQELARILAGLNGRMEVQDV
jgi:RNA polymerase sigma factor (sigma-70 family)